MLKRAHNVDAKEVDSRDFINKNSISNPIMTSSAVNIDSQREWNRNFKKKSFSNEVNNLIDKIAKELPEKQEELIRAYRQKQIVSLRLRMTANPKFMRAQDGHYYRLNKYEYVSEPSVINVDEAGNYVMEIELGSAKDIMFVTYDINNKPVAIKLVNYLHVAYKSERVVAKKLNMKKELVYPNKLHGYSGNSSGLIAAVKNLLSTPIPSGCYFDKSYSFYRWNSINSQFEVDIRNGMKLGSPLMSDYEIKDNVVLRTDYDGVGIDM